MYIAELESLKSPVLLPLQVLSDQLDTNTHLPWNDCPVVESHG